MDFETLVRRYSGLVYTVVSGILGRGRKRDIEEVMSDVFVAYWQTKKYDESDPSVRNLLIVIARRQAVNRYRQLLRTDADELNEELAAAGLLDDIVAQHCEAAAIREVIASLKPPDNEIFTRRYYYCQSVKEIARALGIRPKKVENRLYYAKKAIRERLLAKGIGTEYADGKKGDADHASEHA